MATNIVHILKAVMIALIMFVAMIFIIAFLSFKLRLSNGQIVILSSVIYILGAGMCGFLMGRMSREKRLLKGIISGICFYAVVFILLLIININTGIDVGKIIRNLIICMMAAGVGSIL